MPRIPTTVAHGMRERRSEEHTSELQSRQYLVCRLLLEKKKNHADLQRALYHVCGRVLLKQLDIQVVDAGSHYVVIAQISGNVISDVSTLLKSLDWIEA